MEDPLMTTKEVCDWLRISRTTIGNWRQRGLPFTGVGHALRYRKSEVEKWLKEQRNKQ